MRTPDRSRSERATLRPARSASGPPSQTRRVSALPPGAVHGPFRVLHADVRAPATAFSGFPGRTSPTTGSTSRPDWVRSAETAAEPPAGLRPPAPFRSVVAVDWVRSVEIVPGTGPGTG